MEEEEREERVPTKGAMHMEAYLVKLHFLKKKRVKTIIFGH
jgi:hypothetical protein